MSIKTCWIGHCLWIVWNKVMINWDYITIWNLLNICSGEIFLSLFLSVVFFLLHYNNYSMGKVQDIRHFSTLCRTHFHIFFFFHSIILSFLVSFIDNFQNYYFFFVVLFLCLPIYNHRRKVVNINDDTDKWNRYVYNRYQDSRKHPNIWS